MQLKSDSFVYDPRLCSSSTNDFFDGPPDSAAIE